MKNFIFVLLIIQVVCQQDLVFVKDTEDEVEAKVDDVSETEITNDEVFVPTLEWQVIKPGQAIPPGLHVRLDMQTGIKEAKILVEEETEEQRHARLVNAMKNIKDDFKDNPKVQGTGKSKFRSIDDLRKELKDGNIEVKTDYLVMKSLIEQFSEGEETQLFVLGELEFYLHQYDNALDFLQLEGLKNVVIPSINSSNSDVRKLGCALLGGFAQSHPEVQAASLSSGLVSLLLRLTHLDPETTVSTKAFYALSSIVRNFPEAQAEFLRQGGLAVLSSTLQLEGKGHEKLQVKILSLLYDLLTEREQVISPEKKLEYEALRLEELLPQAGLCQVWDKVLVVPRADRGARREDHLSTIGEEWPLRQEHDVVEKVLGALAKVVPVCKEELGVSQALESKLAFLDQEYSVLRDRERAEGDEDRFFSDILSLVTEIRSELYRIHTEL